MSARAPADAAVGRPFDWRRVPGTATATALFLVLLYAPMAVLVVFAFNAGEVAMVWRGFSVRWFARVLDNQDIREAALNSLIVAGSAAAIATTLAVAAALALESGRRLPAKAASQGLLALPLIVPEIVVAVSTLVFFAAIGLDLGLGNLIIAHTVFCIPVALLPIQARLRDMPPSIEEAARDLYADEWRLLRRVTLPLAAPGVLAGATLAFVTSLDDFLISQMIAQPGQSTLPVYIYGMMRRGVTPEVNAVSTLLLAASLALVGIVLLLIRPGAARHGGERT